MNTAMQLHLGPHEGLLGMHGRLQFALQPHRGLRRGRMGHTPASWRGERLRKPLPCTAARRRPSRYGAHTSAAPPEACRWLVQISTALRGGGGGVIRMQILGCKVTRSVRQSDPLGSSRSHFVSLTKSSTPNTMHPRLLTCLFKGNIWWAPHQLTHSKPRALSLVRAPS